MHVYLCFISCEDAIKVHSMLLWTASTTHVSHYTHVHDCFRVSKFESIFWPMEQNHVSFIEFIPTLFNHLIIEFNINHISVLFKHLFRFNICRIIICLCYIQSYEHFLSFRLSIMKLDIWLPIDCTNNNATLLCTRLYTFFIEIGSNI